MRVYIFLTIFAISIFANVELLNQTQKTDLVNFIKSNSNYLKLDSEEVITDGNISESNLTHIRELEINSLSLTKLPEELSYLSNLSKFYFHESNLSELQVPNSFYMLDFNYSSTPTGELLTRSSEESINQFLDRLGWVRPNRVPTIESITSNKVFVKTYEFIEFDINSSDEDGEVLEYVWNFSDGDSSNLKNPIKQFSQNGVYEVNCTVFDDNLDKSEPKSLKIYVSELNIQAYSKLPRELSTDFFTNEEIEFNISTDESQSLNFFWDFNDSIISTEKSPKHRYSKEGEYVVKVRATNPNTSEIIEESLTILVSNSNEYIELIDSLEQGEFEKSSSWKERVAEFEREFQIYALLKDYNPDSEELTFEYDLERFFIDTTSQKYPLSILESRHIYQKDTLVYAVVTLKAKLSGEDIELYIDNFFLEGATKSCTETLGSEISNLIEEFDREEFESISSHKRLLDEFNAEDKRYCFNLNFKKYDAEESRLYADVNLSIFNLPNQDIVIDVESIERGENIEFLKSNLTLEGSFNILFDQRGRYRFYLERDRVQMHPKYMFDKFEFVTFNIDENYLENLETELARANEDYESETKWSERVLSQSRTILKSPNRVGVEYDALNDKLYMQLDLNFLNLGVKIQELNISSSSEAVDIYENSRAIIELEPTIESEKVRLNIDSISFRVGDIEYPSTETDSIEPDANLSIYSGWNLLSNPVNRNIDDSSIFDALKIYKYDDENWSENPTKIEYREGFWLKSDTNRTLSFYGGAYYPRFNSIERDKWYLLGTGSEIDRDNLKSDIEYYEIKYMWVYRDREWIDIENLTHIKRGEGFWIKR